MPEKLFHAVKDGLMVDILDVSADDWGLKCGCTCVVCGAALVAHNRQFKGRKKAVYFSHHTDADCGGARESALHLLAKEVAGNSPALVFPDLELQRSEGYGTGGLIAGTKLVRVTNPQTEPWVNGVRPDLAVIASAINKTVYLEFKVTHEVEETKADLARKSDWMMIEYDLSDLLKVRFDREMVKKRLTNVTEAHFHKWVWHPWIATVGKRFRNEVRLLPKGANCPANLGRIKGKLPSTDEEHPHAPCIYCPSAASLSGTESQGCTFKSGIFGLDEWVKAGFKPNPHLPRFFSEYRGLRKKMSPAAYAAEQDRRRDKEHNRVRREGNRTAADLMTTEQDWVEVNSLLERICKILNERLRSKKSYTLGFALHLVDSLTKDIVSRGGYLVSARSTTEIEPGTRFDGQSRIEVGTIHKANGTWHLETREPQRVKVRISSKDVEDPPIRTSDEDFLKSFRS